MITRNKNTHDYVVRGKQLLLIAIGIILSMPISAQTPIKPVTLKALFPFVNDVKQYSTQMVPNETTGPQTLPNGINESVWAGTIHHSFDATDAHFLHLSSNGIPDHSESYTNNYVRDQANGNTYLHVVDLEVVDDNPDNVFYITCLSRESPNGGTGVSFPYMGVPQKDYITIIAVDETGQIIDRDGNSNPDVAHLIDNKFITGYAYHGYNLYPVSSYYKQFTHLSENYKILYICGTVIKENWSTLSTYPKFYNKKEAFVIAVNVDKDDSDYLGVMGTMTLDMPATGEFDYDIAMKMDWIDEGILGQSTSPQSDGSLYVTGSVNGSQENTPGYQYNRSAVMNMILDPVTLAISVQNHFMSKGPAEYPGDNEYGIAFYENADISNPHKFVIGNKFDHVLQNVLGGNYYDYYGFDPRPRDVFVQEVSHHAVSPSGLANMQKLSGQYWGLEVLETSNINTADYGDGTHTINSTQFVIMGMQTEWCSLNDQPSANNVNDFLMDVSFDNSVTATSPMMLFNGREIVTFTNNTGTGIINTDPNNYYFLGGGPQNVAWWAHPATRLNTSNEVLLYEPKMQHDASGGTKLGFVWVSADPDNYDLLKKPWICGREICTPSIYDESTVTITSSGNVGFLDLFVESNNGLTDVISANYDKPTPHFCEETYNQGRPSYKNTGIEEAKENGIFKVYPNPATNEVSISLPNTITDDADVQVQLVNMQGQVVTELFSGKAIGVKAELQLPNIAAGIYMIHILSDGIILHNEKLSIQQ